VLKDAAEADGGILLESTRRLGITYRPRTDLYWSNVVELNYTDSTIQPSLEPVEDDQTILNQVTYTADGSSYSETETDGARGTLRAASMPRRATFLPSSDHARTEGSLGLVPWNPGRIPVPGYHVNLRKIESYGGAFVASLNRCGLVIGTGSP